MPIDLNLWSPGSDPIWSRRREGVMLFALNATATLGAAVATHLGQPMAAHEEREFEDGEHKIRPLEPVRGCRVYVIQSLYGEPEASPNDKLCRLLFFVGALKDAGAAHVTVIAPYLAYARKDRRTKPNDPITIQYIARMFEAVGTDTFVTLDVHNPAAFENAFRCPTVALTAAPLFIRRAKNVDADNICVVSPDTGGAKRAELFREGLETETRKPIGNAFAEKYRSAGVVSGDLFVGNVFGSFALIIDDLISTGGTLLRAAKSARVAGAAAVWAIVTHGLFMPGADEVLADPAIDRLIVTDAVPPFRLSEENRREKVEVISCAPLLAEAIARVDDGSPFSDLLVY